MLYLQVLPKVGVPVLLRGELALNVAFSHVDGANLSYLPNDVGQVTCGHFWGLSLIISKYNYIMIKVLEIELKDIMT